MRNQNSQKIQKIEEILIKKGFKMDSWGNYKKNVGEYMFRVKFNKTSLRFEWKSGTEWVNIASDYYKNVGITDNEFKVKNLCFKL